MLIPSPRVTDSLTCFSGRKTLFYPFLRFTQCFLSLLWDKYTLLATLSSFLAPLSRLYLDENPGSGSWRLCWGKVDLLLVHSLCESILALVCFIFGCSLYCFAYLSAALHLMCAFTFLHLDILDRWIFLGGLGVYEVKGPIPGYEMSSRKPRNRADS